MTLEALRDRLRTLLRKGELDKVLAPTDDDALPWSTWFEVNVWMATVGAAAAIYAVAVRERPADARPSAAELVPAAALVVLVLAFKVLAKVAVPRWQRRRRALVGRGRFVPAALVQANTAWFADDNEQWLPASIVVSFDAAAAEQPTRLELVAGRLQRAKETDRRQLAPDEAWLAWDLYHELGPLSARAIPAALCGGLRDCWLASVLLPPRPLRLGDLPLVVALPDDRSPGAASALPAELLDDPRVARA
jgi:hypothetical protein